MKVSRLFLSAVFFLAIPILPLRAVPLQPESLLTPIGRHYTLPNGLTILLYPTSSTHQERTEIRLALSVGSAHESEKEEGAAHFIEHMAFAPEWIMRTLTGYGNRYGSDFNAYTGYDRTVYSFSIPSGCDTALRDALRVVRYWITGMQFPRGQVERERGVIAREIADFAPDDPLGRAKLAGNPLYARFPIGRVQKVQTISGVTLSRFYKRHYAPGVATLIMAGPIDTAAYARAIRDALQRIPNPIRKPTQPNLDVFLSNVQSFTAAPPTDDSICSLSLFWPYRFGVQTSCADWLRRVCAQACAAVINDQLYLRGSDLTFSVDWYLHHEGFVSLVGSSSSSARDTALRDALGVVYGIARHCADSLLFDALRTRARAIVERTELPSTAAEVADRMVDEALVEREGGVNDAEREWVKNAIQHLDTAEWRRALRSVAPKGAPLVADMAGSLFTPDLLAETIVQAERIASSDLYARFLSPIMGRNESRISLPTRYASPLLSDSLPQRLAHFSKLNATLYRVNNGVPLLTKRIVSGDSTVYIVATWRGGFVDTSTYSRSAQEAMGNAFELSHSKHLTYAMQDSLLYQERISQLYAIGSSSHRVMMACPSGSLDLAVRMLRDRLVEVAWDTVAFDTLRAEAIRDAQEEGSAGLKELHPTQRVDAFTMRLVDPQFSVEELRSDVWRDIDIKSLSSFYSSLFARGQGLQVVAVGDVDGDTIAAAFARNFDLHWERPLEGQPFPHWHPKLSGVAPSAGAATFISYWRGDVVANGLRGSLLLKLMRDALQDEALRALRMEKQIVYSPFVSIRYDMLGLKSFVLAIEGECESAMLHSARKAAEDAMQVLVTDPLPQERLNAYQQAFLAAKNRDLTPFAATAWRDWLVGVLEEGAEVSELEQYEEVLKSITSQEILDAFRRLVDQKEHGFLAIPLED